MHLNYKKPDYTESVWFDEIECINNLKRGSYKAFSKIYDEYADCVFGFALKQLRNREAARDVVQDTFMRLWINRRVVDCSGNLRSFIFSIARFRVIDTLRRQMSEPTFEEYIEHCAEEPADVSPEDIIMYEEFLALVASAKDKLTPRERQIYELSRDSLLSNRQIAEKLGISEQTVKNHISSALHTLRGAIGTTPLIFIFWL